MYKIVPITSLTTAKSFISSDKIIEISKDRTKMSVGTNDYEHKNKFYLSTCIDNADKSLNSYLSAYDNLSNTYITSSLTAVYIRNKRLITRQLVDAILSSDAFLTKDGCKSIEAECISYINEIKNKAVSIIMAKLNESFIKQNSVKRKVYGQSYNKVPFDYKSALITENYPDVISGAYKFDFKKGEFTLASLLFDGSYGSNMDLWTTNLGGNESAPNHTYFAGQSFGSAQDLIDQKTGKNIQYQLVFNADISNTDYKIKVPACSFDYGKDESIPIAKLITFVLKNQIYKAITNICQKYAAQMISVPTVNPNNGD